MAIIKEAVVATFPEIVRVIQNGADRIELNADLAAGGITPSKGMIAEAIKYVHDHDKEITVMIRPRGGNFVYNDIELKIMEADILEAQQLGADGVAFGALTDDNTLDEDAMENLIAAAGGMTITMHMAFDALDHEEQVHAIDWLTDHGVERILTHGGDLATPIEDNINHLKELLAHAANHIAILPGGGITSANYENIAKTLTVYQVHGTKIVD
ncbi:copper homeostasis protein CutC [Periweissella ghanensis]|uniref:PF03932 family protein CutC n=1 Tax=Periweissella ghanensis TaxID=467997 RepID=A0ABN8BPN7_9LACO|nr:copper homeostasis protein CutC [Periweissella ghanensis]MCM0600776.1 copper homeostasis protein CutC [Periweissella ghanensis]CAH0418582.1 Copper homeostasis protein CutC [Periweissella ghanensis]